MSMAGDAPPIPRKCPEFVIFQNPGKEILLSAFSGKVVVLAFVRTTCPHCRQFTEVLNKLQVELVSRGFQAIAVAFNENAADLIDSFARANHLNYTAGSSPRDPVLKFLGLSIMEDRWVVPQIVVVDRNRIIRAQSAPLGSPDLRDETKLRNLINKLLSEPVLRKSSVSR
jgi:peroxiredoxin